MATPGEQPPPQTQQYPTLSSGYTQQLQREAARCQVQRVLQQLACCPPSQPLKIQTNSGARTLDIQKCYTFTPVAAGATTACGVSVGQPVGIQAGGTPASRYTQDLIDRQYVFNPETRFEQYKPYEYPFIPSTIIFTSPTVPVPPVDSCLLPGVNVSGPNPINATPTITSISAEFGGYLAITWVPGNDRSIVKYNVYVNGALYAPNVTTTTYTIGPYPVGTKGNVQIEPVARNNWKGPRSAIEQWSADL